MKEINCPNCGCGFTAKYDDWHRICLYCPFRWNISDNEEHLQKKLIAHQEFMWEGEGE